MLEHPFAPVCREDARVLVLGTFPSVRSRAENFYYGHPRNRFWAVLAAVYGAEIPGTAEEKRAFLYARRIALWDVAGALTIRASADASIRDVVPSDVPGLLRRTAVTRVCANGQTAALLYDRHLRTATGVPIVALPSTSPANAAWGMERLVDAWRVGLLG